MAISTRIKGRNEGSVEQTRLWSFQFRFWHAWEQ